MTSADASPGAAVAYVFGYGSLVDPDDHIVGDQARGERLSGSIYGFLEGFQRAWNIAFRNEASERKHKHYVDPESGSRISGAIAMLGIAPSVGAVCNGVAIPVDERLLALIDRREGMLYARSAEVGDRFSATLSLPLYTYMPLDAGYEVYANALEHGDLCLPDSYLSVVLSAFERAATAGREDFERTTTPPACPVRKLELWRMDGEAGV